MNKYYIYCHTNLINNKKYIGLTKQKPEDRWKNGLGYKRQEKFFNAILKYGWDNFKHEILYYGLTEDEASQKEKELIKKFDSYNNGYNADLGGSITNHSPETLEKMRQSMLGKKHSEEIKNKIRKTKEKDSLKVYCVELKKCYNSIGVASKETLTDKSSISKCCKGLMLTAGGYHWEYYDKDLKEKYKTIKSELKNKSKKRVKNITTNKEYNSVKEASLDTNTDASNITKACKGKYKTAGGYQWRFLD